MFLGKTSGTRKLEICIIIIVNTKKNEREIEKSTSPRARNNNSLDSTHTHVYGHQKDSCRSNESGHPVFFLIVCIVN